MRPIITPEEKEMLERPLPPMTWTDRLLMILIYALAICFSIWMLNNTIDFINWITRILNF